MQPGDRLVCVFVGSHKLGSRFTEWPLHATVVPWFRLAMSSMMLAKKLGVCLQKESVFAIAIEQEEHFGDKLANLVRLPNSLPVIEQKVRQLLKDNNAWIVDETTQKRQQYRPHVTIQKNERLHAGDSFMCTVLSIVEQRGDYKEVVGEVALT